MFIEECATRLAVLLFFALGLPTLHRCRCPCQNQPFQHTDGYLESDLEPSRSKFRARLEEVSQPTSDLEGARSGQPTPQPRSRNR